MKEKRDDYYTALICDDCQTEIFVDVNMLMVKNRLWKKIINSMPQTKAVEDLCADCMEERLGRPITVADWKITKGIAPPCNLMTEEYRNACIADKVADGEDAKAIY